MKAGFLWNVIKGIVIGVANIAPGVSGSALSISMGVYDKILGAISGFLKDPKKSMKTLAPFAIGMAVGILALSFLLESLFTNWPFQMNLLFLGLVAGCIPSIWGEVKKYPFRLPYLPVFVVFFVMVMAPVLCGEVNGKDVVFSVSLIMIGKLFLVGMLAAATLIVPGVSGTLLLAVMGYYLPILRLINRTVEAVTGLNFPALGSHLIFLVPFGAGVIIGGFLITKAMEFLLDRLRDFTYWGIFGIVLSSPLAMLFSLRSGLPSLGTIISGLVLMCVGAFISNRLSEKEPEAKAFVMPH